MNIEFPNEPGVIYEYKVTDLTSKTMKLELDKLPQQVLDELGEDMTNVKGSIKLGFVK